MLVFMFGFYVKKGGGNIL